VIVILCPIVVSAIVILSLTGFQFFGFVLTIVFLLALVFYLGVQYSDYVPYIPHKP